MKILNYGQRIPVAELFARIDAVDANAVKRVANRFFFDQVQYAMLPKGFASEKSIFFYFFFFCLVGGGKSSV